MENALYQEFEKSQRDKFRKTFTEHMNRHMDMYA